MARRNITRVDAAVDDDGPLARREGLDDDLCLGRRRGHCVASKEESIAVGQQLRPEDNPAFGVDEELGSAAGRGHAVDSADVTEEYCAVGRPAERDRAAEHALRYTRCRAAGRGKPMDLAGRR